MLANNLKRDINCAHHLLLYRCMASLEASPRYTGEASQEEAANLAEEATQPLSIARAKDYGMFVT